MISTLTKILLKETEHSNTYTKELLAEDKPYACLTCLYILVGTSEKNNLIAGLVRCRVQLLITGKWKAFHICFGKSNSLKDTSVHKSFWYNTTCKDVIWWQKKLTYELLNVEWCKCGVTKRKENIVNLKISKQETKNNQKKWSLGWFRNNPWNDFKTENKVSFQGFVALIYKGI